MHGAADLLSSFRPRSGEFAVQISFQKPSHMPRALGNVCFAGSFFSCFLRIRCTDARRFGCLYYYEITPWVLDHGKRTTEEKEGLHTQRGDGSGCFDRCGLRVAHCGILWDLVSALRGDDVMIYDG